MWSSGYDCRKSFHAAAFLICALWLTGCAGDRIASYETGKQTFNWGEMSVWMSGMRGDVARGNGYLIVDFLFDPSVIDKGCSITLQSVSLRDPDADKYLIDAATSSSALASSPIIEEIGAYTRGQILLSALVFDYERSGLPYDLRLDMDFDCGGEITSFSFSETLAVRMVQPVLWEQ